MMIDTKPYQLNYSTYRSIVFNKLGRNSIQLFPFLLMWTLLFGWQMGRIIALYSVLALLIVGLSVLLWFSFKNLKPFLKKTQLRFDEESFFITIDENTSQWKYGQLRNVIVAEHYWLLYITINKYVYVSKDIFHSEADFIKFKSLIKG